jgi:hypothetical protein
MQSTSYYEQFNSSAKKEVNLMNSKSMILTIFFVTMLTFIFVSEGVASDPGGWTVCNVVRIGTNAEHGWAYLELREQSDAWGRSVIFAVDQEIRKEALAVALTALSLGEPVRVLIRATTNPNGYQILRAVYTYTP